MSETRSHPRVLTALMNRVWALHPDKLQQIMDFVATQVSGKASLFDGNSRSDQDAPYAMHGDVAVIPVLGVIDRRMNLFTDFSGGTSTQMLERAVRAALGDPDVRGIVLDIDSPGGSVSGPDEVGDLIREARERKTIVAFTGGLMASAAYWIGSAASRVVATANSQVGSIGVAAVHYDMSEADRMEGVKRTILSAGAYKRIASDEKPLSEEGRDYLQSQVDTYYTLFVDAVAANRGMPVERVLADMADGRIFIGEQAREAGLVDMIGTFNQALDLARAQRSTGMSKETQALDPASAPQAGTGPGVADLTAAQLKELRPDLVQAMESEAKAAGEKAGTDAERARVLEILDAKGDAAVTRSAVAEGTPAAGVYKMLFEAERAKRGKALDDLKAQAAESVGQEPPADAEAGSDDPARHVESLSAERAQAKGITVAQARQEIYAENPGLKRAVAKSLGRGAA